MDTKIYLQAHREAPEASRRVQAGSGNRTGFVISATMGHSIDYESNRVEKAAIYRFEHADEITEYYAQPKPLAIALPDRKGKLRTIQRTLDFLLVDEDEELTLVECKTVSEIEKLAEKNPHRWAKGKDGRWQCPPLQKAINDLGMRFLLLTDEDLDPQLTANLEYLSACPCRVDTPTSLHKQIAETVGNGPKTITELCNKHGCLAHDVIEAYQLGFVYINLEDSYLGRPDITRVYSHRLVAVAHKSTAKTHIPVKGSAKVEVGDIIDFDGAEFKVDVVAKDKIFIVSNDGGNQLKKYTKRDISDLLAKKDINLFKSANTQSIKFEVEALIQSASLKTLEKALYRAAVARGDLEASTVSIRSEQRWRKIAKESVAFYGVDFAAFLKPVNQGCRRPRLPEQTYALMAEVQKDWYLTKEAPTIGGSYNILVDICNERGIQEPSYNTFKDYLRSHTTEAELLRKRLSSRAAYSVTSGSGNSYDPYYLGDYAWHRAHIDAKSLDLETICPRTQKPLGKLWMTLVIAPKVRMVLGYALTYEAPSANTTMLALRDVYQQWGALPNEIVMDNGREFKNLAISKLLAAFGTNVIYRPPASPRFGSIIERFFGVFDKRFAHHLLGSTHAISRKSGKSRENNPALRAVWDIGHVDEAIRGFLDVYHDQMHISLAMSPNDAMEADMRIHPCGKEIAQ